MKRGLFNIAAILSAVACVLAAGMWSGPRWRPDHRIDDVGRTAPDAWGYAFDGEGLVLERFAPLRPAEQGPAPRLQRHTQGNDSWVDSTASPQFHEWVKRWPARYLAAAGFRFARVPCIYIAADPWCTGFRSTLTIPYWFITVCTAFLPFIGLKRSRRMWVAGQRSRTGRCPSCGYDLTGNASGVCPECGTAG